MREALKIAYFGQNFSGFQYQPNVRTVEGELFKGFKKMGIDLKTANYKAAGRTDAGVHAFGQVIAFNVENKKPLLPRMINSNLPDDIISWGWAEVPEDFDPRKAISRTYMYVLYAEGYDITAMRKAIKMLIGTHDFSNFTRKFGENKTCVRTIYSADLRVSGDFLIFEIEGNAFTWNMVRCIVSALEAVGSGRRSIEWFKLMLTPEKHKERIEPAPPHGLILKDVKYENIEFEIDDYAWNKLESKIENMIKYYGTLYKLFKLIKEIK